MNVLAARSHNEAVLYVLLRDCVACHRDNRDITDELDVTHGVPVAEYTAFCRECGNVDVYAFELPGTDPQAGEQGVVFGGPEPSGIIDAGEWLAFADRTAAGRPGEPAGLTDRERSDGALAFQSAAAAVREAAKFIEPGAHRLPRSALRTDRGRELFDRDPWRFSPPRLAAVERAYREVAERLAGGRPIWG